jgi:ribosome-binding protein aMBF1 (putative translation factor)
MNPAQCRAARGLLDWSRQALAEAAHIDTEIIGRFEDSFSTPQTTSILALKRALEAAGVIFVDDDGQGAGVRLRKSKSYGKAAVIPLDELNAQNDE